MAPEPSSEKTTIPGPPLAPEKRAAVEQVRGVFDRLKKAMKTIGLYRHNTDRYTEYLEPFFTGLDEYLSTQPRLQLRLDAVSYKLHGVVVFEDESRDTNLIYPLWQAGVRLLVFKQGITSDEVLRFFLLSIGTAEERRSKNEDIITQLWKAELDHVEYVVVEGFKAIADEDIEEVDVEVEKVVAYLYRQLQSNSADYLRFARVASSDLDLELNDLEEQRSVVIQGQPASDADRARIQASLAREERGTLQKMVVILFQVLELATTDANYEDVAEAFVQLLDALLLQENFTAIHQIRERFAASTERASTSPEARLRIERCAERFHMRMAESQRLQTIGQIMNTGVVKDADGVRHYFEALGEEAIVPLLEILETLQLPPNRRLVCDVLVRIGEKHVSSFVNRLNHPASNVVKDMLYILDQLDPPDKYKLFANVLDHPNAVLRLETLATIGRNNQPSCFDTCSKVLRTHADSAMRAQAARCMPNFDADKAGPLLLEVARGDGFDKLPESERKAIVSSIVLVHDKSCETFVRESLEQKSGFLAKKRVDDMKLLLIESLELVPSIPAVQLLADIAKDKSKHSKEVAETALSTALRMRQKLLGA